MTYFNQLIPFNNTQFNLLDLDIASELLAMSNKSLIEINSDNNIIYYKEELLNYCLTRLMRDSITLKELVKNLSIKYSVTL